MTEHTKRILFVEYDPLVVDSMVSVLKEFFEVDIAKSLEEALAYLQNNNYDAVSTNMMLPEKKNGAIGKTSPEDYRGNQVVAVAKSRKIFVVALTGDTSKVHGCDAVFEKGNMDMNEYIQILKRGKNA